MINISEEAKKQVYLMAVKRDRWPLGLRLGIRGGGCSGFEYIFEWSDKFAEVGDHVIDVMWEPEETNTKEYEGLSIFIDPKSLLYLDGSTLDHQSTMMNRGFFWKNPNQTGSCSCGKSIQF